MDIINEYQDRVHRFVSEKDNGIYDALNKGLITVSGDIVGILHSDDVFFDSNILSNINKIFSEKTLDGIYGDVVYTKQKIYQLFIDIGKVNLLNRIFMSRLDASTPIIIS